MKRLDNKPKKPHPFVDLSGQMFGTLRVISRAPNREDSQGISRVCYLVKCQCGVEWYTLANYIKGRKAVRSCDKSVCRKLARLYKAREV